MSNIAKDIIHNHLHLNGKQEKESAAENATLPFCQVMFFYVTNFGMTQSKAKVS